MYLLKSPLFTEKLNLSEKVSLHKSVSSATKMALFKVATAIIYTPSNEHFGIVPVESMYMEVKCFQKKKS